MRLSVGLLYDSVELLESIRSGKVREEKLAGKSKHIECAPLKEVLKLALACAWVVEDGKYYEITSSGRAILEETGTEQCLRHQLADFIARCRPPWDSKIPGGVAETRQGLSTDELQCFREAGLLTPDAPGAIEWWDRVGSSVRDTDKARLLESGRRGERLSIASETIRTGRRPRWISFESNYAGYDLLSFVDRESSEELRIEVKASEKPWEYAQFEVSREEWEMADSPGAHKFHLWLLGTNELLVLAPDDLDSHIPRNCGQGTWTSVRVPFTVFRRESWQPAGPDILQGQV